MKHFIDITRETCPMTFVKVKLMLAKLGEGEQLEVLLNEGEPLENVPRSCEEQGYTVLSIDPRDNGQHMVLVQK
jgi:tRNA 2-thiouridine synthesizing protein A